MKWFPMSVWWLRLAPAAAALALSAPSLAQICASSGGANCDTASVGSVFTITDNTPDLQFDDTDGGQSDWRVEVNSLSGTGASYLGVVGGGSTPLRVDAGAPSNSLRVDSTGMVGFGTATPAQPLHMIAPLPVIRLESTAMPPRSWDIFGDNVDFSISDHTSGSTPFRIRPGAPANSIYIETDGRIGMGTANPQAALHLVRTNASILVEETGPFSDSNILYRIKDSSTPTFQLEHSGNNTLWNMTVNAFGDYLFKEAPDPLATMRLEKVSGNLVLPMGRIVTQGPTCGGAGCDYVFQPGYQLESIEQHAEAMWSYSHLPAVGPTAENARNFDVTEKVGGILNELEKAHIYIERLNEENKQQRAALAELESRVAGIQALEARLARMEAVLMGRSEATK